MKIHKNHGKHWETFIKTWSLFLARYGHPRTEKRSKIGHFSQRIVFTFPLGFADDFGPKVLSQTPKNAVFRPRSYSKGPNHALEKVLTKETPGIDYSVSRRARYVQNTWKRHQDTVFWIDIDLGIIKEGLKFYQTRSNAIILQGVLPPSCIMRAERLKGGEPLYKRQYLSPRPPPKISLRHDLNWTMNWALQLNIDQSGNSFNSHLEKQFNLVLPSQPNPLKPMKTVRGNP